MRINTLTTEITSARELRDSKPTYIDGFQVGDHVLVLREPGADGPGVGYVDAAVTVGRHGVAMRDEEGGAVLVDFGDELFQYLSVECLALLEPVEL
ncbi:hypothetical protein [Flexivirga sp.]|uniref:hypothetical protein n=1 Tax=Flexivirga sp. TaxID=1962927 RepID=UPI003F7E7127